MLGRTSGKAPKLVKRYANRAEEIGNAAQRFAKEVAAGEFPRPEHEDSANGSAPAPVGEKEEGKYGAGETVRCIRSLRRGARCAAAVGRSGPQSDARAYNGAPSPRDSL